MESQTPNSSSSNPQRIIMAETANLLLDPENPRLAVDFTSTNQDELIRVLWTEMAVEELALSIAANGFFPEEPLFVIPKRDEPAKYIVVEGNRRLAAVQILLDENLKRRLKANVPVISEDDKAKLSRLPVSVYEDRYSLWAYLSFRHINGQKGWDAYSKARYIAKVYFEYRIPIKVIADRIGDQHETVVRMFHGYVVLDQAERETNFNRDDIIRNRFYFSHLYTAIEYPEIRNFLSLDSESFNNTDPVPKDRLDNLHELMIWIYGSKAENRLPIVEKQARDLTRLRRVIGNQVAIQVLRSGYTLDRAYDVSVGDSQRFSKAVVNAREEMKTAKSTVTTGFSGEDSLTQAMEDIQDIAKTIIQEMRRIRRKPSARSSK